MYSLIFYLFIFFFGKDMGTLFALNLSGNIHETLQIILPVLPAYADL